eukprot:3962619-Pleurochrysis_carterae.AAC.1
MERSGWGKVQVLRQSLGACGCKGGGEILLLRQREQGAHAWRVARHRRERGGARVGTRVSVCVDTGVGVWAHGC